MWSSVHWLLNVITYLSWLVSLGPCPGNFVCICNRYMNAIIFRASRNRLCANLFLIGYCMCLHCGIMEASSLGIPSIISEALGVHCTCTWAYQLHCVMCILLVLYEYLKPLKVSLLLLIIVTASMPSPVPLNVYLTLLIITNHHLMISYV